MTPPKTISLEFLLWSQMFMVWSFVTYGVVADPLKGETTRLPRSRWMLLLACRCVLAAGFGYWLSRSLVLTASLLLMTLLQPLGRSYLRVRWVAEFEICSIVAFTVFSFAVIRTFHLSSQWGALSIVPSKLAALCVLPGTLWIVVRGGTYIVRGILRKSGTVNPSDIPRSQPTGSQVSIAVEEEGPVVIAASIEESLPATIDAVEYNRGRLIGNLERIVLTIVVAAGSYAALAFLVAAKGVVRSDRIRKEQRFHRVLSDWLSFECLGRSDRRHRAPFCVDSSMARSPVTTNPVARAFLTFTFSPPYHHGSPSMRSRSGVSPSLRLRGHRFGCRLPQERSSIPISFSLRTLPLVCNHDAGVLSQRHGHPQRRTSRIRSRSTSIHKGEQSNSRCGSQVGKQLVLDMRSEGEIFGLLSRDEQGSRPPRRYRHRRHSLLSRFRPSRCSAYISSNAEVSNYLLRTSVTRYMDRSLQELRTQTGLMGDTERLLYSLAVSDVARAPALLCRQETTIREAAQMAVEFKGHLRCSWWMPADRRIGIVTDRDFAEKVVARATPLELQVTEIMSAPVVAVEASERLFLALLAMVSRNIHHVLVTQQGRPTGVLTAHDLMVLQGKSPLNVVRFIDAQTNVQDLSSAQQRIAGLLPLLLREGAKASHVTRVVAEVNDRLIVKILQFAEARLGPPPATYCWVVLGSEGRREQTFKTDQDNALIFSRFRRPIPPPANTSPISRPSPRTLSQPAVIRSAPAITWQVIRAGVSRLRVWQNYFQQWISWSRTSRYGRRTLVFRHASRGRRLLALPDARRWDA